MNTEIYDKIIKEYHKDQVVKVRAWWRREMPTKCRIVKIDKYFVNLYPMEGNNHFRAIALRNFEDATI